MDVTLVAVMPDGRQSEIPLRRPVQVIGRQTDCQIRIPSPTVSRHHCEIIVDGSRVSVRDLGSSNGTYVNKRRITQAEVAAGDLLAVGDLVFVVRIDGRPVAIESEDVLEDGQVPVATPPKPGSGHARGSAPPAPDDSGDDFDFLNEDEDIRRQPRL
jgi:pSer/pThr/pTyr-binding forkhead associated (FHA) protein